MYAGSHAYFLWINLNEIQLSSNYGKPLVLCVVTVHCTAVLKSSKEMMLKYTRYYGGQKMSPDQKRLPLSNHLRPRLRRGMSCAQNSSVIGRLTENRVFC